MTVAPIPLLLATFRDEEEAGQVLADLGGGDGDAPSGIADAATLSKDGSGVLRVTNARYRDARGFFVGGIVGTFIGGVAGPAMAIAARGGVLGSLRARLQSAPLKFELLAIGEELPPGSSLLVVVAERGWADRLSSRLHAVATLVLTYELRPSLVDQLNHGGNVAFLFPLQGAPHNGNGITRDARGGAGDLAGPLRRQDAVVVSAATLSNEVPVPVECRGA